MADSNISTRNVWPNYSANNVKNAGTTKDEKNNLGKDDFLKILLTQLQNQDPTQPLEDKEFISQMATFSSLEQMSNMAGEMKQLRQSLGFASGLIGKQISYTATDENGEVQSHSGVVESITLKSGGQYAKVDGVDVALDKITEIANQEGS